MTITHELRQALIRVHLLNAQAEAFVRWHKAAIEPLIKMWPMGGMEKAVSALKEDEQAEIDKLLATLPGADEFFAMEQLVRSLTNGELARLQAEDRLYMAEVRCKLDDALGYAREGQFSEAYIAATKAWERIDWVLTGRKRAGNTRAYRRLIDNDIASALAEARDGVGEMVHEFHHAHLALAR
jgi:hypothetical protein